MKRNKMIIGVILFICMIVALFIINHVFLNNVSIVLQSIVSGLIATLFTSFYILCIWRK